MTQIVKIFDEYNIPEDLRIKVTENLSNKKLIILCDDSGSMNNIENGDSRWNHLKNIIKIIAEMQFSLRNRCDIRFLNKLTDPCFTSDQVDKIFALKPSGITPLVTIMKSIMNELKNEKNEIILLLALDGNPTDNGIIDPVKEFHKIIKKMPKNITLSVMVMTSDKNSVSYLFDSNISILNDYFLMKSDNESYNIGLHAMKFMTPDIKKNDKKCIIV